MIFERRLMPIFLFCLILLSCGDKRERIPGQGPIIELHRYKHWLYVYTGPYAKPADFVRMDRFGDFKPGISPLQWMLSYAGAAEKIWTGDSESEGVEYRNQYGRIRIVSEIGALILFPNNRRPSSLLTQHLLKYITPNAKKEVFMLFACGFEQPYMTVGLESGQLQEACWVDKADLARRPDPTKCTD